MSSQILHSMKTSRIYEGIEDDSRDVLKAIIEELNSNGIHKNLEEYRRLSREYTDANKGNPTSPDKTEEIQALKLKLIKCIVELISGYACNYVIGLYLAKGVTINTSRGIQSIIVDSLEDIRAPKFLQIYNFDRLHALKFISVPKLPTEPTKIDQAKLTEQLNRLKITETRIYNEIISENEVEVLETCLRIKQGCKTKAELLRYLDDVKSALVDDYEKFIFDASTYQHYCRVNIIPSIASIIRAEDFFGRTLKKSMRTLMFFSAVAAYAMYKHAHWQGADPTYEKLLALSNERYPVLDILQKNYSMLDFYDFKHRGARPSQRVPTNPFDDRGAVRHSKFQAVGEDTAPFTGPYVKFKSSSGEEPHLSTIQVKSPPKSPPKSNFKDILQYKFTIGKTVKKLFKTTRKGKGKGKGKSTKIIRIKYR